MIEKKFLSRPFAAVLFVRDQSHGASTPEGIEPEAL